MIYKPVSFTAAGPLSVVQIAASTNDKMEVMPFSAASGKNLIEVKEVSDGGSVNLLIVNNLADCHVFLMDGDILTGAKQNRVLNTSVLLAPNSQTKIPVSCVEQGRWRYESASFIPTEYTAPASMRKQKLDNVTENLRVHKTFDANQGAVWNSVASFSVATGVHSPTSNLSDVYDGVKTRVQDESVKLEADPTAHGAVFFLDSKVIHADIFASQALFQEYYQKIVRGMSLELRDAAKGKKPVDEPQAKYEAVEFLDAWEAAEKQEHEGVGVGTERRARNERLSGMQLEFQSQLIHLSVFNAEKKKKK